MSGQLAPDERLYESRIAEQLGLSRTPVREAFAMLEIEGFVLSVPNRGTVVRRILPAELRGTYDVRIVLETHAATMAAERIAEDELAELARIQREMRRRLVKWAPGPDAMAELADLNARFHQTVVEAARNPVLTQLAGSLIQTAPYARTYHWLDQGLAEAAVADHDRLLLLLAAGEADQCGVVWRRHLAQGRDYLVDYLERTSDDEPSPTTVQSIADGST